jgi:hypothetical protein
VAEATSSEREPLAAGTEDQEQTMTQKIGDRELALRAMREADAKQSKPTVKALAAELPKTSGKPIIKRKAKKRTKR